MIKPRGTLEMTYTFYCLAAAFLLTYLTKLPLAVAMAKEGDFLVVESMIWNLQ